VAVKLVPPRALKHLQAADPILGEVIEHIGRIEMGRPDRDPNDHYGALVRAITGQQLSVKAAASIHARFLEFFGGTTPTPQQVLDAEPETMRAAAGLSRMKVAFLRSLAEHVISGELDLERMSELSDEDVIAELIEIKGIGQWTAHMFLMFHLSRPDVLAVGDLGIRAAMRDLYGLDDLPAPDEMERIALPWRPWRTIACRYLWRSLDNEPD
jgi:DNA-3-methyladenine glycosylase II